MLRIGCHLSFTNGYAGMARDAIEIGANVFQFFTRNPRGGRAKPVDLDDIAEYNRIAAENGISPIVAHAPYTMNPSVFHPIFMNMKKPVCKIIPDWLQL